MGVPDVFDATSRLIILASLALKDGLVFSLSLFLYLYFCCTLPGLSRFTCGALISIPVVQVLGPEMKPIFQRRRRI